MNTTSWTYRSYLAFQGPTPSTVTPQESSRPEPIAYACNQLGTCRFDNRMNAAACNYSPGLTLLRLFAKQFKSTIFVHAHNLPGWCRPDMRKKLSGQRWEPQCRSFIRVKQFIPWQANVLQDMTKWQTEPLTQWNGKLPWHIRKAFANFSAEWTRPVADWTRLTERGFKFQQVSWRLAKLTQARQPNNMQRTRQTVNLSLTLTSRLSDSSTSTSWPVSCNRESMSM